MKILATKIETGMTIKVTNLFDMSKSPRKREGIKYSIESHKFLKSSPIYKVLSVTEEEIVSRHRTQHRTVSSKEIVLTLEGVTGNCSISTKQKVFLI